MLTMKKLFFLFFAVIFIFSCLVTAHAQVPAAGKILILYYTKTGNTKAACEALQKALGADIQEIKDLNSRDTRLGGIGGMLKTLLGMHTAIEPKKVDLSSYTTVIISAPIWAAKFGLAMRTFVETNRFDGKNVIIFITADSFIEDKYQAQHKGLLAASGGNVNGYFQVQACDMVNKEKVPRTKEKIVEETLKLVPEFKKTLGK
jgi:flavodoxin